MFEVLYSSSPGFRDTSYGDESTLWAILAYSALQEARGCEDLALTGGQDENTVGLTPRQMYDQARTTIPEEDGKPELGYSKALLILALYQLYRGDLSTAWRLIGGSVRISLEIQESLNKQTTDVVDEHQARALLGCFALDTVVSSHLGKPPHLRSSDIRHMPAIPETGPSEWEPWFPPQNRRPNAAPSQPEPMRGVSIFNRWVDIIRILNDILWEPPVGVPDQVTARHLTSLRNWSDHLPRHCLLPSLSDTAQPGTLSRLSPQLVNLHLAFKSTVAVLRTQHNTLAPQGIPFDQCFPESNYDSISHLLSTHEKKFGNSSTPPIFASYKFFGDKEKNIALFGIHPELATPDSYRAMHPRPVAQALAATVDYHSTEDIMSTATPSDSIAASQSEHAFPFNYSDGESRTLTYAHESC